MARRTSTIARASAVALLTIMNALAPALASVSSMGGSWSGGRAGVGEFHCTPENRAPCTQSRDGKATDGNRANPRCDYSKLFAGKLEGPYMPCAEKRSLFEMLVFFHNTVYEDIDVEGNGFWYSLTDGTAIGSLRNKDIIDWDTDIDIVVPIEKRDWLVNKLQAAAKQAKPPYVLKHPSMGGGGLTRLQLSEDNDAHIDIWGGMGFDRPEECITIGPYVYPRFVAFPLKSCSLQGSAFPCFAEVEKYLDISSGKDWRVPATHKENPEKPTCQSHAASFLSIKMGRNALRR